MLRLWVTDMRQDLAGLCHALHGGPQARASAAWTMAPHTDFEEEELPGAKDVDFHGGSVRGMGQTKINIRIRPVSACLFTRPKCAPVVDAAIVVVTASPAVEVVPAGLELCEDTKLHG